jgi:hypothetical protein
MPPLSDGILTLLDVLLRVAALIIESHHAPLPIPASRLIAKTGTEVPHQVGQTANKASQQMCDALLEDTVGGKAERV